MGYYVNIVKSDAVIPQENLQLCYEKMCALNVTHDHKKTGGSWQDGKQVNKWFSWMDADYPTTCNDAKAILDQMGFDTEYNDKGDLLIVGYDNKMGQEELFLKAIENEAIGSILWNGEDGSRWTTQFHGDNVYEAQPIPKKLSGSTRRLK